jgi:peptide/nickel transport system substrate-binding protein
MSRRTMWFAALLLALMSLLAACGGPAATTTPGTQSTATGGASAPTGDASSASGAAAPAGTGSDGVLVVTQGTPTFQRNFNPFAASPLEPTRNGLHEPLMVYSYTQGKLLPWLATEYKWSEDNKTLTFTLQDGVKWSDGQPFTAADVAFTFNLLKSTPGLQGPGLQAVNPNTGYVDAVTAPDDKTITFTFKTVFTPGLYDIVQQNIVPEHIWKVIADPVKATNENPVGTGPFTQISSFQAQVYQVDKNPNYWQAGKPLIQGLRFRGFAGNDPQGLALTDDQVDWSGAFVPDIETTVIAKNPNAKYWFPQFGGITNLTPNTTKKPLDDANVRKAISMALNREQIITVAVSDYTKVPDVTGLSDAYAQYKAADPTQLGTWTTPNPEQANQLLDAAGLKQGAGGKRTLPDGTAWQPKVTAVNGFTDWIAAAQIVVQNLQEVGIDAVLETIDTPIWVERRQKGDFDLLFNLSTVGPGTPYASYRDSMSKRTSAPTGTAATGNYGRFVSAEADTLLNEFAATSDLAKQKEIAAQLQKIFADQAPFIPLWPNPNYFIYSTSRFQGWPSAENPYAVGTPNQTNNPERILLITTVAPK